MANMMALCEEAVKLHQGNCSGAVKYIAKQAGYDLPDLPANQLIDYFVNNWQEIDADKAQTLADHLRLVVAGKKSTSNGHVVAVLPGGKTRSGGYEYKNKQGEIGVAAYHGNYPTACSTGGGWPGAESSGNKSVFDSWGSIKNYDDVKYWVAPIPSNSLSEKNNRSL